MTHFISLGPVWTLLSSVEQISYEIKRLTTQRAKADFTASMPSFARTLHHHLPPWKQLKSRLPFGKTTTHTKSSQSSRSHSMGSSTAATLRWEENQIPYISGSPLVNVERRSEEENEASMYPYLEMNSPKSRKTFTMGVRHIKEWTNKGHFSRNNVEHTRSTMNAANAFICSS